MRELLRKIMGAMANSTPTEGCEEERSEAIKALNELFAQPAPEPVATVRAKSDRGGGTFVHWVKLPVAGMILYTTPAQAPAPLTSEEKKRMWVDATIDTPSPANCYFRGVADAERAIARACGSAT